jgi:hypothetical protein
VSVSSVLPLLLLHTRAVPSSDAVAILVPSGDQGTDTTLLLCPVSVSSVSPIISIKPEETGSDPSMSDEVRTITLPD